LAFLDLSVPFFFLILYKVLARLCSWHVPSWHPRWGARRRRNLTAMLAMKQNQSLGVKNITIHLQK